MANSNGLQKSSYFKSRKIVWSEVTTRAFGHGWMRELGRMSLAEARELSRRYGGRFVVWP